VVGQGQWLVSLRGGRARTVVGEYEGWKGKVSGWGV
jgi:hypothetical protein